MARVLDPEAVTSLAAYVNGGGGRGLDAAGKLGPGGVIAEIEASVLRGRGGAGFPTGTKWATVAANRPPEVPGTVVVNGAEGEPGSFKDRSILRRNPYRVLEGALVAALAVGADRVVVALKASFGPELARVREAIAEVGAAGWAEGVELAVLEGPGEYLYGEETALLEVLEGRQPFPRIAPPFRHGAEADEGGTSATPTLVNNVETLANVGAILAEGPEWFRTEGTDASPGTIVCTVTGRTARHGVAEVAMGTPLRQVIDTVGGGPSPGSRVVAVLSGVSHPLLPAALLDTPLTYEDMEAAGTGLGAAGFIVFDETADLAAVAQGVARFLAVESCGQCTPCKQDGLALAELLDQVRRSDSDEADVTAIEDRIRTVTDEARCFLAHQQQRVLDSVFTLFLDDIKGHLAGTAEPAEAELIAPIVDLDGARAVLDEGHAAKQPDWTFDEVDSGTAPADRIDQRSDAPE
ncbi:MAG: hypothetical protein M3R01_13255 [Actinomycetota bacterium]|nr:hypothetical protein [Actinomycetota bacterium]